ncbi:rhodanese-like domain-containing protein [Chitinolyticbacter meiyuanensis]|uniref:rhodanese-like domain-containing protein n=1 Tax=Chitinolyticbacter meiyuanensis TaxID=682798 RepID=UPI0011E5CFC9|nr:rhodanese-like domain-containing protein [Chitinolyticbacter meiyuanensis]
MPQVLQDVGSTTPEPSAVLESARAQARASQLGYAGGIQPAEAWALFSSGAAKLIDVRTAEERKFVGHVPGSGHVAWQIGAALQPNPRFALELGKFARKTDTILLLCRSGKRSAAAAEAATRAGYTDVFNVLEGFEGDLDAGQQRGASNGWRHAGLPWVQD